MMQFTLITIIKTSIQNQILLQTNFILFTKPKDCLKKSKQTQNMKSKKKIPVDFAISLFTKSILNVFTSTVLKLYPEAFSSNNSLIELKML